MVEKKINCMVMYQYPTCDMHFVHRKNEFTLQERCCRSRALRVMLQLESEIACIYVLEVLCILQ